jgi:hypothetical protein
VRIYTRGREPDLRHGLVSLLLAAFDAEPGEVWLISPWLRDVELPASGIGHFASVFGGHREHVLLSELLVRVASRHRLGVVVKPPGELVPLRAVQQLVQVAEARNALVREAGISDYVAAEQAMAALAGQAAALSAQVTMHADTLRLCRTLHDRGAEVRFLDRLHAKLLWTGAGTLLGSANFTHGGFGSNEEIMVEVTTLKEHLELGETARDFAGRAVPISAYDLRGALAEAGVSEAQLRGWPASLGHADLPAELLRELSTFLPPAPPVHRP